MTEKRKDYKNIEDQMAADKRWAEKNKEHRSYLSGRTSARSFIRNRATHEDLIELEALITERKIKLEE